MNTATAADACVSPDGKSIIFMAVLRGRPVQCSVSREVLEQYFWAPTGACDERLLKVYAEGYRRIAAVAERKLLRAGSESIRLDMADFSH
jgi:hypothetical protein